MLEGEELRLLSGGKRCLENDIDVGGKDPNGVEFLKAAADQR